MKAKEKPLLGGEGLHKRIATEYVVPPAWQAAWLRWQREAARLFHEYWRTGNQRHLRAFFRHVVAMRAHAGGHTQ
jgi:hypothetical protein